MSCDKNNNVFNHLPTEIWSIVIDILQWESWATLHSLNLSCRDFHQIVSPVLFGTIRIYFPPAERWGNALRFQNTLSVPLFSNLHFQQPPDWTLPGYATNTDPQIEQSKDRRRLHRLIEPDIGQTIYHHVRILVVSYGLGYEESKYSQAIQRLVENLKNLQTIRWRGIPFPPHLFQILHGRHSPPQLFYEGAPQAITSEPLLIGASYTKSLSITCPPTPVQDNSANKLGKVILSLPRLERLSLKRAADRFWRQSGACISPVFCLGPDSELPRSLRILSFANFTFNEEQAAAWARCIKPLNIYHLGLDGFSRVSTLLSALVGSVPGLRSFAIRVLNGPDAPIDPHFVPLLDQFLQSLNQLECLFIRDLPKEVLGSVIRHQGKHLRQLRFGETGCATMLPPAGKVCAFSPDEIGQLTKGLPCVERLSLDLRFEDHIPYEYLDALACFPSLKNIEFNTRSFRGARVTGGYPNQWLDESIAREAFRYVDTRTRRRLAGLNIKVGQWDRIFYASKNKELRYTYIYAAWRESHASSLVQVIHLPCRLGCYSHLADDDMYEQTMDSAGLGHSDRAHFGPGIS
ncbi:hypothetical protein BJX63DRAFT_265435 [Aspergillus granulosus]|uniref:F-box domain-containing protein n=1 Tax=Aspergillus granulosus TaxID=176169 RepID=A0ABR4H8S7_9EURO